MRSLTFSHSPHPLLSRAERKQDSPVEEQFDQFTERMTMMLFGEEEARKVAQEHAKRHSSLSSKKPRLKWKSMS